MWQGYLSGGYYDEKGNMRREIIVEDAQRVAKELEKVGMTSTSLRRFYNKVMAIKTKMSIEKDFEVVRPMIDKLVPIVSYNVKRKVIPDSFESFIKANVAHARKSHTDFLGFFEHFQCVIAFSKNTDDHRGGGGRSRSSQNYRKSGKNHQFGRK
ncbi:type III-A CRISPR-associated protein Csm2 [Thermoactinomyces mirandus]|uniref:CRISPR system Cms protein Csm2 n=1 Tax=Thermoactinomyces mirandus TaxID=2756294 RepID=A0A7W2ARW6_9BACL|nr:type III-A CRISPR-associated protein Csm2 [Thermoactinomyces mirandus]MBA4602060.1 type III-A CRISPR-associated protein Csm2 [Thermoactinomyces mirandus]